MVSSLYSEFIDLSLTSNHGGDQYRDFQVRNVSENCHCYRENEKILVPTLRGETTGRILYL